MAGRGHPFDEPLGVPVQADVATYLSPSVRHLIVDSREKQLTFTCEKNFITSQLTFDWESISNHLTTLSEKYNGQQTSIADFETLWPIFIECGRKLQGSDRLPSQFCHWTTCEKDIEKCFREVLQSDSVITPLKVSLQLSSIFENAIGNVYLLKKGNVPFLLRDLLASDELLHIFGQFPMLLAQTMLGTPLALNVRNVCWHGFPTPTEIHSDIAASLIVLITSFGEILLNLELPALPCRSKMDKLVWAHFLPSLEKTGFPELSNLTYEVSDFIKNCSAIPNSHRLYWNFSFNFLCSGSYGECLMLLLPALEHTLRCAFCVVNNCPQRVVVAEQRTLYTTLDEILDQFVSTEEGKEQNKLPLRLGVKIMDMLMDIFNSFGGPRLRDKLSHGECDFNQIPDLVANHVFCIALLVLLKLEPFGDLKLSTSLLPVERTYSAKFHSVSILKSEVIALREMLQNLELFSIQRRSTSCDICAEISNFQQVLIDYSTKYRNICRNDVLEHINFYFNEPIITLYRSKSDLSVIATLKRIILGLKQICGNTLTALGTQETSLGLSVLRSRQRLSYSRLLDFIPSLQVMVKCVILMVFIQLLSLPKEIFNSRFIKNVLKYTDNLASHSRVDKNRWVDIIERTSDFCINCTGYFQTITA